MLASRSRLAAAVSLTAEPGKVYYYSVKVDVRSKRPFAVAVAAIDPAESNVLFAQSPQTTSQPKK